MRKVFQIALVVIALYTTINVQAQNDNSTSKLLVYSSFSFDQPVQNLDNYSHGFGVYSNFDYNFNKHFAARLDIGWNDFSGPEKEYIDQSGHVHTDHPNMSIWEFTGGLRAKAGPVYLEGRGGYFTGVSSWGYVPAVGVVVWKLDIQASYTFAGDKEWAGIRLGYYF